MIYDPWELIGRYFLTGLILNGLLIILLIVRLLWLSFRSEVGVWSFLTKVGNIIDEMDKGKRPIIRKIIEEIIFWPYGIVRSVHGWMKVETKAVHETKTE